MDIPCGHIGKHEKGCHFCELSAKDSRYAILWGRLKRVQDNPSTPRAVALRMKSPCIRLGNIIEASTSCGCPPVYNCSRFGRVVKIGTHKEGLRACASCPNYEQKPLALDHDGMDPLPEPEGHRNAGFAHDPEIIATHLAALKTILGRKYEVPKLSGRGVILCGGGKYWPGIVVALKLLHRINPSIPVQVWHRGNDEPIDVNDIAGMDNVKIVNAYEIAVEHPCRILRGWESKLFALKHCGFETALYLDADAYCVADPTPLFDIAEKEGFVFWSDLAGNYKTVKWPIVWPDGDNGIEAIQGGQLAIHLPSVWHEVQVAHWMNQHSDFYYQHIYGDQDTWRVAFAATGRQIKCLGPAPWNTVAFVCPVNGVDTVVHRCQGKLFKPKDIPKNNHAYSNPKWHLPREQEVFAIFSELMRKDQDSASVFADIYANNLWNGGSGSGSKLSEAAPYINFIQKYIEDNKIKTVVDVGCGDGRVAVRMFNGTYSYTGIDVVKSMIDHLKVEHDKLEWILSDFYKEVDLIPKAKLLLCKDVLHHWPTEMIVKFITRIRELGKWRHVLFTQDHGQQIDNEDTYLGGYRGLDLNMSPLNKLGLQMVYTYGYKSVLKLV